MKIAFVYDVIYPWVKGGVEKRVHELATRLAARGHDVHIIGMKYWEGPDSLHRDGVTLHGICPARPLYTDGRRKAGEAIWFGVRLTPFLLKEEFDIIDCQQFPFFSAFPVKLASVLKNKPFVITWHEVWGDYWYEYLGWTGLFGKTTERLVAALGPHAISVSGTTAENLRHLGVRGEVRTFPNGIDPVRLRSIPPATVTSDIVFVGRLIREKHVDLLVQAFHMLPPSSPGLTLLIVGEGPEGQSIRTLIRELGIGDRVLIQPFLDSHDTVISLMKSSRVCAIPSTREGFGITALEALACGLPVVTVNHRHNAITELITEQTGFLTSLAVEDLAATLQHALAGSAAMKAACMAEAGGYDWDRIVTDLERYYQSLVSREKP